MGRSALRVTWGELTQLPAQPFFPRVTAIRSPLSGLASLREGGEADTHLATGQPRVPRGCLGRGGEGERGALHCQCRTQLRAQIHEP